MDRMTYDEAETLFLESRQAMGLTDATLRWYGTMLGNYRTWLELKGKDFNEINVLDTNSYISWLRQKYAPASLRQSMGALKAFYNWLTDDVEYFAKSPIAKAKRPKVPEKFPPIVTESEFQTVIKAIKLVIWSDHRDKAIIETFFYTGLRLSEVMRLKVCDVDFTNRYLSVFGKGQKVRRQPIPPPLLETLKSWIEVHRPRCETNALFMSSTNGGSPRDSAITDMGISWAIQKRFELAGLKPKSPHAFRHGFAAWMLKNGASTRLVQQLMGHSFVTTTEAYLKFAPDQTREMFDKIWQEKALI